MRTDQSLFSPHVFKISLKKVWELEQGSPERNGVGLKVHVLNSNLPRYFDLKCMESSYMYMHFHVYQLAIGLMV